ncbi:MAG: hypothetical protein AB7O59_24040 [Pirellulales bacterium]
MYGSIVWQAVQRCAWCQLIAALSRYWAARSMENCPAMGSSGEMVPRQSAGSADSPMDGAAADDAQKIEMSTLKGHPAGHRMA